MYPFMDEKMCIQRNSELKHIELVKNKQGTEGRSSGSKMKVPILISSLASLTKGTPPWIN